MSLRMKKIGFFKKKKDFQEKQKQQNGSNPSMDSENLIISPSLNYNPLSITHMVDGELVKTTCPSIILNEYLIVDEKNCVTEKLPPTMKVQLVSPKSTLADAQKSIVPPIIPPNKPKTSIPPKSPSEEEIETENDFDVENEDDENEDDE